MFCALAGKELVLDCYITASAIGPRAFVHSELSAREFAHWTWTSQDARPDRTSCTCHTVDTTMHMLKEFILN